jgi:hypothetical protein
LLSERLDGQLGENHTRRLTRHLAACAACRSVAQDLAVEDRELAGLWPAAAVPVGFAAHVVATLPPRADGRTRHKPLLRTGPAIAAALVAVAVVLLAVAPVRAGLRLALDRVLLRETNAPPVERLIAPGASVQLEDARRQVPWRIRLPSRLPEGYRLVAVTAGEVHDAAIGPTVVLHYQQGDGPRAPTLRIIELRAARPLDEPVAPGAATEVRIGGRPALLIDGAWETRGDATVWVRGTLLRLILQDGDLVIQLEGDPRDGWDAAGLIRVADSLQP